MHLPTMTATEACASKPLSILPCNLHAGDEPWLSEGFGSFLDIDDHDVTDNQGPGGLVAVPGNLRRAITCGPSKPEQRV